MPGNIFEPRKVIEERYRQSLYNLVDVFLEGLTNVDFTQGPGVITRLFSEFSSSGAFQEYVRIMARRMVTGTAVEGARNWREAARRSMRGQMIYNALRKEMQGSVGARVRELIDENARLITSFPESVAEQVARYIGREAQKGRRHEEIADDVTERFPRIARSRVNLIARTETAKAHTELVRARAEEVDLEWYVWQNSEDARVRYSHRKMGGVLVTWGQAPSPEALFKQKGVKPYGTYHAGETFN